MSLGSPPHTRGKDFRGISEDSDKGITPAHAGKSQCSGRRTMLPRDHPRTRGEKSSIRATSVFGLGSPPHTRGKDLTNAWVSAIIRITPAHAGKRRAVDNYSGIEKDHPRTRGEKAVLSFPWMFLSGSPPHTRGKVERAIFKTPSHGITPAHAGKS